MATTATARKPTKKLIVLEPTPNLWAPAIFLYVFFSVLIILCARGNLWLDEIWSIDFARGAHSFRDLFLRFRHDNNHPLNTAFQYLVRQQSMFLVDRMLAVLSGIATLVIAGEWTRRFWGRRESILTLLLMGMSFPLLLYFSEARGYAPAICFALVAFVALEQNLRAFKVWRLLLFLIASALGILSHSTFIIATIALSVMHASIAFKKAALAPRVSGFLLHQVPALLFPPIWYFVFVRGMEIGGGPVERNIDVVGQAAGYLLGLPVSPPGSWMALLLVLLFIGWGTRRLRNDGRAEWIFFPTMVLFAPILVLVLARPKYVYFRYFILCFPFLYMFLGYTLARATATWKHSIRWVPWLVVSALLVGHVTRVEALLRDGRGQYAAAWARIAKESKGSDVHVGSDHDFRNRLVLRFYSARASMGKWLYYDSQAEWKQRAPEWILVTQGQEFIDPPDEIPFTGVGTYRFVARYDAAPVSGWGWFLYRKQ